MSATIQAQHFFVYQNATLGQRTLGATAADASGVASLTNAVIYWDASGNAQTIFTPALNAKNLRGVNSRDYEYFTDGTSTDRVKWNIATGKTAWGTGAPISAPVLGSPIGSGNITLKSGRVYFIAFFNSNDQTYSDLSPASSSTGPLTNQNQPLNSIPVSTDPQITNKLILATADGGDETTLYEVGSITNATTTFTDTVSEPILLASQIWQDTDSNGLTHGLFGNQPPPNNGSFPTVSNGRVFLAIGEILLFSKSLADVTTSTGNIAGRYEEAWPPVNAINVSAQAEQIRGLISDGQVLYIGTEQHIFRLLGDSPTNFSIPQVIFPETGLLNQDCWQIVYLEGTPVGTMWLTPDFRCMSSDFNTYQDVGTAIQSTLNTINTSALSAVYAVMVSNAPYNYYILALPTGSSTVANTFCMYDMRLRKWYIWQFADNFSAGIFYVSLNGTPRWIFSDANGIIRLIDPTTVSDRQGDSSGSVSITSTIKTAWLDLGDKDLRKTLNEIEVVTTDPNIQVTVEGASNVADFNTPTAVVSAVNPITSNFGYGFPFKVPLAGNDAAGKFYRFTFVSDIATPATTDIVVGGYSIEALPLHRY